MIKQLLKRILTKIRPSQSAFIDASDEFIEHLCWVNPGFLHRGNVHAISYSIKNMPPQTSIIEVGVFCGLSTNVIAYFRKLHNREDSLIFNTDIWQLYGYDPIQQIGTTEVTKKQYRNHLIATYQSNVEFFSKSKNISTFEMHSDIFFDSWGKALTTTDLRGQGIQLGGPIGFAYIDGSHLYNQVKADFLNVKDKLANGAFILFDDSADEVYIPNDCEVSALMKEIIRDYAHEFELVFKNPNYLFQKL
jgi:hypothetical protein